MKTDVNEDSSVKGCSVNSTVLQLQCIFPHVIMNQVFLRITVVVNERDHLLCILHESDCKKANNLQMVSSTAA